MDLTDFLRRGSRSRTPRSAGLWRTSLREARVVLLAGLALAVGVGVVERGGDAPVARDAGTAAARGTGTGTGGSRFALCGRARRIDCVVDGDTFWMDGTKIRIADIDTPETHPPRCAAEARAGRAATLRMQTLLNAGPFTLVPIRRDADRYGRKLRRVERDGQSLGAVLVDEGLARDYGGGKRAGWCGVV
jgi:endonuclease YncB( thermonuclease family)